MARELQDIATRLSMEPHRSAGARFKDLKLNTGTVLLVLFAIASSAVIWNRFRPQFVLIWLLSVYIFVGLLESLRAVAHKLRSRARSSVPPTADAG